MNKYIKRYKKEIRERDKRIGKKRVHNSSS